jgi:hypothetical protein
MNDEQLATLIAAINHGFDRVLRAIETARPAITGETMEAALATFKTFDWSSIGATVIETDEDGVSMIRAANGKICKRRSNDKFGTEIWFSYPNGRKEDGTPDYKRVIEFRELDAPEPLGRKTMAALSSAKPSATQPTSAATQRTTSAPATTPAQPAADPVTQAAEALGGKVRDVPAPELVRARAELAKLAADAKDAGIDIPSSAIGTDADDVAMCYTRAATLRNLLEAHKRSGPPPAPPETSPGAGAVAYGPEAGERVSMQIQALAARMQGRGTTPAQDGQLVATLNALCGSEDKRREFLRGVFLKESLKDLAPAQKRGLYDWLKPSMKDGKAISVNPDATHAVAAVLIYATTLAQPAGVPA